MPVPLPDPISPTLPPAPKTGAPTGNKNAAKAPDRALTERIVANMTKAEKQAVKLAAERAQAPNLPWFARDTLRRAAGLSALPNIPDEPPRGASDKLNTK